MKSDKTNVKTKKQSRDGSRISKIILNILHNNAECIGLSVSPEGYVKIKDLLKKTKTIHRKDIDKLIEYNNTFVKPRIVISDDGESIRATIEDKLTCITDPSKIVPMNKDTHVYECIYACSIREDEEQYEIIKTYKRHELFQNNLFGFEREIYKIKDEYKEQDERIGLETTGLSKPLRKQYVKFVHPSKRINMKHTDVYIYCDIGSAIKSGIDFYIATNGMILTKGNQNGVVPSRFLRVEYLKSTYQQYPRENIGY
jgi:RNA:NAD 2'-phosphotransferase (TPT1/KptA family)